MVSFSLTCGQSLKQNTLLQCHSISILIPHANFLYKDNTEQRVLPHKKLSHMLLKDFDAVPKWIPHSYCLIKRSSVQVVSPNTQTVYNVDVSNECSDTFSPCTPFFHRFIK